MGNKLSSYIFDNMKNLDSDYAIAEKTLLSTISNEGGINKDKVHNILEDYNINIDRLLKEMEKKEKVLILKDNVYYSNK